MSRIGSRTALAVFVTAALAVNGSPPSHASTPEAQALYLQGVSAAKEGTWPLAIESFDRAHQLSKDDASIYYALAVAHDKAGDALPAMAWYVAYVATNTEPDKATYARQRIAALDRVIQTRLRSIFDAAVGIAKVSGYNQRPGVETLAEIAGSQQAAGMAAASSATLQIIKDSLGIATWDEYDSSFTPMLKHLDAKGSLIWAWCNAGDIAALRAASASLGFPTDDDSGRTYSLRDETLLVAEITHFILLSDAWSRVHLAEAVSRHDPLRNIDVKVSAALQRDASDASAPVHRLTLLTETIGNALVQIRALGPSASDSPYLSAEAQDYLDRARAYLIRRRAGKNDDRSLRLAWDVQRRLGTAMNTIETVRSVDGNDRLALYRKIDPEITDAQMDNPRLFGLAREDSAGVGTEFSSLVWTRRHGNAWQVYRKIARNDFRTSLGGGGEVMGIDSLDPAVGQAILQVMDSRKGTYSWRLWDLTNNREVKFLREADPGETSYSPR